MLHVVRCLFAVQNVVFVNSCLVFININRPKGPRATRVAPIFWLMLVPLGSVSVPGIRAEPGGTALFNCIARVACLSRGRRYTQGERVATRADNAPPRPSACSHISMLSLNLRFKAASGVAKLHNYVIKAACLPTWLPMAPRALTVCSQLCF